MINYFKKELMYPGFYRKDVIISPLFSLPLSCMLQSPTWQVQDKMDANNVAYTTEKLSFHTDYPVLQHPPGVRENRGQREGEKGCSA